MHDPLRVFAVIVLEPAAHPADLRWQDAALCPEADPEEWYPEKGGSVLKAKAVCRRCPVREPCLGDALDRADPYGIWGGLSHEERERAARRHGQGTSLRDIIAEADARWELSRARAAEHSREASLASAEMRHAARGPEASPVPQPTEKAALCPSSSPPQATQPCRGTSAT